MAERADPKRNAHTLTVTVDPANIFVDRAITDPAELERLRRESATDNDRGTVFLGVFESDAITDPEELAKYRREPG